MRGLLDDHAHPFPLQADRLDLSAISLDVGAGSARRRAVSGGTRLAVEAVRVRLAHFLGAQPDEVEAVRDARAAADWPAYVQALFADAGVEEMLLDGGPVRVDVAGQEAISGVPTRELLRLEALVDPMLEAGAEADDVLAQVALRVAEGAQTGVAGLKTALAYRTGLDVDPTTSLEQASRSTAGSEPVRRRAKALRDLVLVRTLEQCADLGLPIQVHTGFGDSDLRLRDSEPVLLDDLLRTPVGAAASVVLIHGGFPWHEQVAYLAAVRPNVYAEYSLGNLMSPATTADRLLRIVDLAPTDRILLGSDGHGSPETHWSAIWVLREAWDEVRGRLGGTVRIGWLDEVEQRIFAGNARDLYLGG
ncbi:MAG: amidohydrolase family protein [Nocardioides sp.]